MVSEKSATNGNCFCYFYLQVTDGINIGRKCSPDYSDILYISHNYCDWITPPITWITGLRVENWVRHFQITEQSFRTVEGEGGYVWWQCYCHLRRNTAWDAKHSAPVHRTFYKPILLVGSPCCKCSFSQGPVPYIRITSHAHLSSTLKKEAAVDYYFLSRSETHGGGWRPTVWGNIICVECSACNGCS